MNIYQKLLTIQKAIVGLGKDKSAFNYKYVTGDKVLEHIKPLMNEHGLILKQEVISIDNSRQDYQNSKGGTVSEINSKVMMKFTWIDADSGEKDENLFGANGQNAWDKGVGSALTYGERYFLLKFFHIATDEDDIDNPERNHEAPVINAAPQQPQYKTNPNNLTEKMEKHADNMNAKQAEPMATEAQKKAIINLIADSSITKEEYEQMFPAIPTFTEAKAKIKIANLTKTINQRKAELSKPVTT